jgi:2'-5' RNA ligase
MDERWRLFIGLLLPAETQAALVATQAALRSQALAVRWTRPENLHITLHFLGDIAASQVALLQSSLAAGLHGCGAPLIDCTTLGAFPDPRRPRVLWAGPGSVAPSLRHLNGVAVAAGSTVGVAPEQRAYHPHVTLGYVHERATPAEREDCGKALQAAAAPHDPARPYPAVALMRSLLGRDGPTYAPLATWTLPAQTDS